MPNEPTPDKLDEVLENIVLAIVAGEYNDDPKHLANLRGLSERVKTRAKQAILQLYREWANDLIDDDELFVSEDKLGDDDIEDIYFRRNELRAELRHKLQGNTMSSPTLTDRTAQYLQSLGGYLICNECGCKEKLGNIADKLSGGWPKCHGYTMR